MLTYATLTANGDGLPRRYDIGADGGSGYDATLVLCYEDDELVQAGISPEQEEDLHLYRWDQGAAEWIEYSTVDPVNNRITAINVIAFGVWGIGTADAGPTSARVQSMTAHSGVASAGFILLGMLAVLVVGAHVFTGTVYSRRDS